MADYEVVETFYGTHHKYEVVKRSSELFRSSEYYIRGARQGSCRLGHAAND
jgi:hypothetical protein